MFFSFDGVDGVGKTTQMSLFCEWLRAAGHNVMTCRDPGSTALGEELRKIVLGQHTLSIHRRSEMFLYMAARVQLVEEVIRPALLAGKTVVCDRFLLANVVYQAHAGGLDPADVWQVGRVAVGGIMPDLVFLLDMTAEAASERRGREPDRMEAQGQEFLNRVRAGFLIEAQRDPNTILVVNAARDVETIQNEIRQAATTKIFNLKSKI
jgi:dTMP kinase